MKRFLFSTIVILLSVCACDKTSVDDFKGSYSFKTSGYFRAAREDSDQILTFNIPTRSGQMDIVSGKGSGSDLIISMNITGGDLQIYYADLSDNRLVLVPVERNLEIVGDDEYNSVEAHLTVLGDASKYDDIVLFRIGYNGQFTYGGNVYNIISSDINCRAKLNK